MKEFKEVLNIYPKLTTVRVFAIVVNKDEVTIDKMESGKSRLTFKNEGACQIFVEALRVHNIPLGRESFFKRTQYIVANKINVTTTPIESNYNLVKIEFTTTVINAWGGTSFDDTPNLPFEPSYIRYVLDGEPVTIYKK